MNKQVTAVPTAHIAINKSRVKIYNNTDIPTVYLQKGQEFSIELFNPTTSVILCEIHLNNKRISQGGLVLNPGQRVFLDRYLDIAKKFLFDTYDVANTEEVKQAIVENGDFKVKFYKEDTYIPPSIPVQIGYSNLWLGNTGGNGYLSHTGNITYTNANSGNVTYTSGVTNRSLFNCSADVNYSDTTGELSINSNIKKDLNVLRSRKLSKTLETGRVEKGSDSEQKLTSVHKKWEFSAFHSVEYKMLPVSQKVNTVEDIQVAKYCTNCGGKTHKTDKFCAQCGKKI